MTLGKTGQIVFYINDTEYDAYDYKCLKVLNGVHTFFIGSIVVANSTDRTNITQGNKVKIMIGEQVFFTGIIESSGLGEYGQGEISGMDTVMSRLKRRSVPQDVENVSYYQSKDLDYIIPRIASVNNDGASPWIVTVGTVNTFGTNSLFVRGDNDNKANFLLNAVKPTYYDWYPSYGTDPYDSEVVNVVTEKGGGASKYTFDLDTPGTNASVVNDTKEIDRMWNSITITGYGDGINQIKSKIFHATDNRTTLGEDITATTTGSILVADSSSLPASGNVWIGCEKVAYSAKADATHITISTRGVAFFTGAGLPQEAYAHKKMSPVYDAQYTETSAEAGSSIALYGVTEKTLTERSVIDQNTLDFIAYGVLEDHYTIPRSIELGIPNITDIYYIPGTTTEFGILDTPAVGVYEMTSNSTGLYAAGEGKTYRINGVNQFENIGQAGPSTANYSICFHNDVLYVGINYGYVYRWDGGTTWTSCGQPEVSTTVVYALISFNGNLYASSNSTGKVFQYVSGTTWTDVGTPDGTKYVDKFIEFNSELYGLCNNGAIYKWDGITTWTSIGGTSAFDIIVYNNKLYYISDGVVGEVFEYVSGTTWTSIGTPSNRAYRRILCVMNGKLFYTYAWRDPIIPYPISGRIYRWDGGTTWTLVKDYGSGTGALWTNYVYNDAIYSFLTGDLKIYKYIERNIDIGDNVTVNSTNDGITNTVFKIQAIQLLSQNGLEDHKLYLSSYTPTFEGRLKSMEESTEKISRYMQGSTVIFPVQNYENCDASNYLDMRFYLPAEIIAINKVGLNFKLKGYRAYSTTTTSGGGSTSGSGGSSTPTSSSGSAGSSNYTFSRQADTDYTWLQLTVTNPPAPDYGTFVAHRWLMYYFSQAASQTNDFTLIDTTTSYTIYSGTSTSFSWVRNGRWSVNVLDTTNRTTHDVEYKAGDLLSVGSSGVKTNDIMQHTSIGHGTHDHTVTIANHTHTTPDHSHTMGYAISVSSLTSPSVDVYIGIDGGSMTLKGTYTSDQTDLDITSLVKAAGPGNWIDIQFRANKNMRIEANAYIQAFIRSE